MAAGVVPASVATTSEGGPMKGIYKTVNGTYADVRTLCKEGKLKEALQTFYQGGIPAQSSTYVCLLQGCINMKALAEGKRLHAHILRNEFLTDIFVANTLITMYAKCGSMKDAHLVFDKMVKRDVISWNAIIAGYAQCGHGAEALKIYEQMQQKRVAPNRVTFICILNGCASIGALQMGKRVHAEIIKAGIASYLNLENTLVDMYAKCRSMMDARIVFNKMVKRDVVSWNVIIAGYAQHGYGEEALKLYEKMQQEGVIPNRITFIYVLNACAGLGGLEMGKRVHVDIMKYGIVSSINLGNTALAGKCLNSHELNRNILLFNTLLNMYAKCGSMVDARQVFEDMPERNIFTWTLLMVGYAKHGYAQEAFRIYKQMHEVGMTPDRVTYICVLNACASIGALENVRQVHADIIDAGIVSCINLENTLVDTYAKCGSATDARQVFDKIVERDVVSWNVMIAGYAQGGHGDEALKIYDQLKLAVGMPDRVTFISVLNACASIGALEKVKQVHRDILKAGIAPYINLENTLIDSYAKCGSPEDARKVFYNMAQRDAVSWSAMIAGYTLGGHGDEALKIYEQMQLERVTPDRVTFICVLNACASLGALEKGKRVHADITKAGIAPYINLENALVDMYAKCGSVMDARQAFDKMSERDVVSWNAMIVGYAQHGCGREALQVLKQMQQEGLNPNGVTFTAVLSACSHVGLVDEGRRYFDSMSQDHGLTPTVEHFGCMVDLLGRAGLMDEAEDLLTKMPIKPDASVWGALLGACRVHGNVKVAERAAKCILKWDPENAAAIEYLFSSSQVVC